ncbi:MAG: hypothetical protein MK008_00135 [Bdellovibrionales bacterium]|nr:hypothetical protein [Bdellovibrionales bacterium]
MKVQKLRLNQIIQAQVVEIQRHQSLIVSLSGSLFRVTNTTGKSFQLQEKVNLKVIQVKPLAFQLINQPKSFGISYTV